MTGPTLSSAVASFVSLVNVVTPLLGGIALLIFFWGIIRYLWASGDSQSKASGREVIVWGLVALFVIFSVWGILSLACWSFVGDARCYQQQNVQCTPDGQCYGPY
ncbi:hypothetical protein A3D70_00735 [Candidatus Adlerbacteria bacterium RIFCSPHIGHO2_02_FULL_54_18]|uniref:Uncharacterized protein n=2 Tax=Candidatus Adleribacteriota TaxID=1752736 RepID=A0A1F4Y1F7_9BACT|nr:MAG: hypothetical protein A2949_01205 [Candidatus Adlerbacteria bacterium RIFCSPLOWO2_01_FULL_54_21b]OGC87810.1 MAG: hypothetical protein A3D70_00735 [Candidatus Adlerbacteria bacterium RIFCSPHIGHO2_02_FULL_54_18]